MVQTVTLLLLVTAAQLDRCHGYTGLDVNRMLANLTLLDVRVRPVLLSTTPTVVNVSFNLMSIGQLDTVQQKLVSTGYFQVTWINEYMRWDLKQFGGDLYSIIPDPTTVWRPRLTVRNSMKDLMPIGQNYVLMVSHFNGFTEWFPAEMFETFCKVDVTFFPFDVQTSEIEIFNWGSLDPNEVFQQDSDIIELDQFSKNGEWELMSTRAYSEESPVGVVLKYEMTIRRRPSLLALTVLLPVVVLALVNVFVFTIPSEAGERLAYSMTSLLSFGVFMSFIMDSMPSSSDTLSIVAVYLSSLLVLSAVHVLLCIVSLRLFHRDPDKHPVPPSLQALVVCLEIMLCLDPPVPNKVSGNDDLTPTDVDRASRLKVRLNKWALNRKRKKEAYTDPTEMTWRRVSCSLDKLLFRFFFLMLLVSNCVVWTVMVHNYYTYDFRVNYHNDE